MLSPARRGKGPRSRRKSQPLRGRRLGLEWLEDRTLPSVTLLNEYPGLSFSTSGGTGVPPDSNGAAGPNTYVEAVNQAVSIYNPKGSGTSVATDQLANFYFKAGGLPALPVASGNSEGQSDPFVIYDPLVQRFIVGDIDFELDSTGNPVNGGQNALLLAVSKSSDPATLTKADWNFYELNTTEAGVALQDYPGDPGYNADALVVTFNSFSTTAFVHTQVNAISMSALVSGGPLTVGTNVFQNDYPEFGLRPAPMPDSSPGGPMWFVTEKGDNASLDVIRMDNVLAAKPTFTATNVPVNPYSPAVSPLQPNGSAITSPGFTDSRILNTDEANGIIVATHTVSNAAGTLDNARWYAIDVSSGTPILQQQGDISGGPGVYNTYPAIAINSQGDIGMTYMSSGTAPGQFLSVYVTGRAPGDPLGTMETPVLAQAGAGNYVEGPAFGNPPEYRLGDVVGISVDSDGSFWIANEFANTDANANWGTAIAHFSLAAPIAVLPFNAVEGQPLSGVPVATFTDHSGADISNYTATINWGDGTTSAGEVVAIGDGTFRILGSHTYNEEGRYLFSVSVNNGITTLGPVSAVIKVADAPLQGFAQAISTKVGDFVNNALVAVFTDTDQTNTPQDPQGNPADYTAVVQWFENDGLVVTSVGTIVHLFNNTFAVYASNPFSFPAGGLFTVRAIISDVGGASVTVDSVVSVAHNPAIPPLFPAYAADTGPITSPFAAMEDALTNLLMAERLFLEAVAFGTMDQMQHGFSNLINAYFAYQAAVFDFDMHLPGSTP